MNTVCIGGKNDITVNVLEHIRTSFPDVDLVVIMVKHNEIKENMEKLKEKIVLDCHNICSLEGVYHI